MALARLHYVNPDVDEPLAALPAALAAGLPCFQLRLKRGTDREREAIAARAVELCRGAGAECIVDDRIDIAAAVLADGVHLGDTDLSVRGAYRIVGDGLHIGATARDPESARQAQADGASYLGVGPVYPTASKAGLPEPIGLDGLAAVCAAVRIPVLAIAGITAARVADVLAAGAHGVAVIGAIAAADDPGRATRELLDAIDAAVGAAS